MKRRLVSALAFGFITAVCICLHVRYLAAATGSPPVPREAHAALYGDAALRGGMVGDIVVRVDIAATGDVTNAVLVKGVNPLLDSPALEAAKQWRFDPGSQVQVELTFEYRLRNRSGVVFSPPYRVTTYNVRQVVTDTRY